MRRLTILFSWARFIMLSLSGARQISGKRVRISMRTKLTAENAESAEIQINSFSAVSVPSAVNESVIRRFRAWRADRAEMRNCSTSRGWHESFDHCDQ